MKTHAFKIIFMLAPLLLTRSSKAMEADDSNKAHSPLAVGECSSIQASFFDPRFFRPGQYFFTQDEDMPAADLSLDLPQDSTSLQIEQEANRVLQAEGQLSQQSIPTSDEVQNILNSNLEKLLKKMSSPKPSEHHIITATYQQVEINKAYALQLFDLGFPILYLFKPQLNQVSATSIMLATTRDEVEEYINAPPFMLATILRSNETTQSTPAPTINLRKILLRVSQIGTTLANTIGNNLFNIANVFGAQSVIAKTAVLKIAEWNRFAQTLSLLSPDLSSAYVTYTYLLGSLADETPNPSTDPNQTQIRFIHDHQILVAFMLDMLRPYANAWLMAQNQAKTEKVPLFQPVDYDRTSLPELIERYSDAFQKIIKERKEALKKYSAETKPAPVQQSEQPKKKTKKRRSKKARNRRQNNVITSPTLDASQRDTATSIPDHPIEPPVVPPDVPSLPSPQEITATLVAPAPSVIGGGKVIEIQSLIASQEETNEEAEEKSKANWKQEVARRRAQKEQDKAIKRSKVVAADKEETKEKELKFLQERQKRGYKLLTLLPSESERFIAYLEEKGFTHKHVIYQILLKPQSSTQKVTQDQLDEFFRKLCRRLRDFVNQANIGAATERNTFVDNLQNDLLGTRHNLHNTGEGENLPDNYITHRRGPLIYGGLIPLRLMAQVGSDNRQSLEHYNYRLLSRSLIAPTENKKGK